MRGGATGKRRTTEGFGGSTPQPPPSIEQQQRKLLNSRDSDVNFASSRSSSIGLGDISHQSSIRFIKTFLSSHKFPLLIRANHVPSVKDISETLKFMLSALDYPYDSIKWDDDLVFFFKSLTCQFMITKSSLVAPNTPHNWPTALPVVHWLVELARIRQHILSNPTFVLEANSIDFFAIQRCRRSNHGEVDLVKDLDSKILDKELKANEEERERISQENKELKKSVELENFSARDVERRRRELQAEEKDVVEAEVVRDSWDQKVWELNSKILNQFHQILKLAIDCNQALRRLKLDDILIFSSLLTREGKHLKRLDCKKH
ncbi:Kinetochore protein Ndc80 [Arabidopsis suecica]|uniref:Kinetochore protein NDC80 n=1 Tax=Arabidopsis suecica TaxID=45249 RepID=A0A8T1ZD38_ARASU|nr:Kinetochore protein Ndc80 [Arabidopsis suecica]